MKTNRKTKAQRSSGRLKASGDIARDTAERKHTEEALRENESKFRGIVEHSTDGIVLADEQGNIIEWNQGQERITGLKRAEVGQPVWEVLFQTVPEEQKTPAVRDRFRASTLEFLRTGQAPWLHQFRETESQRPDGTRRVAQGVMFPVKTNKGFMCGTVTRDITDLKRAENALREAESRYRTVADFTWDWEFWLNLERHFVYISPSCERITGYAPGEFMGSDHLFQSIAHPEDADNLKAEIERAFSLQIQTGVDFRIVCRDGTIRWVSMAYQPIIDPTGTCLGIRGSIRDIAARKRAEEALKDSQQRYQSLFEDSPIPVWEQDFSAVREAIEKLRDARVSDFYAYFRDHPEAVRDLLSRVRVLDLNQAVLKLHKAQSKEQLLDNLPSVFVEETYKVFALELALIAEGETMFDLEEVVRTLDGESRCVMMRWAAAAGHESTLSRRKDR